MNYDNWKCTDPIRELSNPLDNKTIIMNFIESNFEAFDEWCRERDIDHNASVDYQYIYCETVLNKFLDFAMNYEE